MGKDPAEEPSALPTGGAQDDTYVVHYDFLDVDLEVASAEFDKLCADLARAGLTFEVRAGDDQSLLVFVRVPQLLLNKTVYQSRLKDYLHGTTHTPPPANLHNTGVDAAFSAESLLSVYHLVNWPESNGGAGITPENGAWKNVKSIFPLHDSPANKKLLTHLSKRVFLTYGDLDQIRDLFGAKTAFYFAFMQTYFIFLFFPALTGLYAWWFLPNYSLGYAIVTLAGCVVFLEFWKIQQEELSVRWDVKGVGHVKINRTGFKYDEVRKDEHTGRDVHYYPRWKLVARQLLQIPFFATSLAVLAGVVSLVFVLEVVVSEVYEGKHKDYIEYLPTVILAVMMPYINSFLEDMAVWLAEFENHRTQDGYEMSASQKMFLLSFISNYLPIFLTAFIYVPLGDTIVPQLQFIVRQWFGISNVASADALAGDDSDGSAFYRDPGRLRNEVVALTVTGQVSDMFEEMIIPYLKHRFWTWYRHHKQRRRQAYLANIGTSSALTSPITSLEEQKAAEKEFLAPKSLRRQGTLMLSVDEPSEAKFLEKVRHQASLPAYNVQDDLSEMVIQFGYLALFSPAWPLVSIGFLINNWIELRSDFLKICVEHQRPHPTRADGIGSWVDSLDALALVGSISTGAIVHLFGFSTAMSTDDIPLSTIAETSWYHPITAVHTAMQSSWWSLPVTIFISEHVFLTLRATVRFILGRVIGSDVLRRERADRYVRRQHQWDDMIAQADETASNNPFSPLGSTPALDPFESYSFGDDVAGLGGSMEGVGRGGNVSGDVSPGDRPGSGMDGRLRIVVNDLGDANGNLAVPGSAQSGADSPGSGAGAGSSLAFQRRRKRALSRDEGMLIIQEVKKFGSAAAMRKND